MKHFYMYGATLFKIAASKDKNCGNESKNRLKSKYLIFSMYISRKLTFWGLTDGKKSQNKNELLHNVIYNYQKSKCNWNFATLLNFHRPSLAYEISKNFITSPNEHTVVHKVDSNLSLNVTFCILHICSCTFGYSLWNIYGRDAVCHGSFLLSICHVCCDKSVSTSVWWVESDH